MSHRATSLLFVFCAAGCFLIPLNASPAISESAQLPADVTPGCDLKVLADEVKAAANRTFDSSTERLRQNELRRVAERAQRCPGAELILAQALHSRAMCYAMESEMEEATSLYRQAVDLLRKSPGGESLLAVTLADLGILYMRMSQLDDAWHSAQQAIRLLEVHAPQHRSYRAKADLVLARVHVERAEFSKAKHLYRKVIDDLGSMDLAQNVDPLFLTALLNYSELVLHTDPSESRKALNLVFAMLQGKDSEWAGLRGWALIARGRLEYFCGNSASGLSTAIEGLELARSALPSEHVLMAEFNAAVGEILFLNKKHAEAESLFAQAVRTWETQGTESGLAYGTLERYAEILRKTGRKDAAKAIARRLRDMDKSKLGMRRANTVDVMSLSSQQVRP